MWEFGPAARLLLVFFSPVDRGDPSIRAMCVLHGAQHSKRQRGSWSGKEQFGDGLEAE